ncbi:MAG: hypothetical protein JW829_03390 [Pirellulales bacterium]|nr:hypothetical protein [Pirellulales bacterium]
MSSSSAVSRRKQTAAQWMQRVYSPRGFQEACEGHQPGNSSQRLMASGALWSDPLD